MAAILYVDADRYLTDLVRYALEREGETVCLAHCGRDALCLIRAQAFDLIMLEVNIPDMAGLRLLSALRAFSRVPVILLRSRARDEDIVSGFEQGADDYVVKPFSVPVLIQRVKAVLRRTIPHRAHLPVQADGPTYRVPGAIFNATLNEIARAEARVRLTPVEGRILHLLVMHAGHVLSAEHIMESVWGYDSDSDVNVIKTHIHHLRAKIAHLTDHPQAIRTVPGAGYLVPRLHEFDPESTLHDYYELHAAASPREAVDREPVGA